MKLVLKKQVQGRLRRIHGQVAGLVRLVESDAYCIDVITQTQAVRSALFAVERLMLKNHLETHAVEQFQSRNRRRAVSEILKVYEVSQKR